MGTLTLPDISEFQGGVDWRALVSGGYPAAIIRAHNGNRADYAFATNRAQAHGAGIRALGLYQYLVAGRSAASQANDLCDLVGPLRPGEWLICDDEEGSGDQAARAHIWRTTVMARQHDAGTSEELYSGASFFDANNLSSAGFRRVWVAAYGTGEPAVPHELWQYTDSRQFPGIGSPCDASVFHGTLAQLLSRVSPPVPPPAPAPHPHHLMEEDMLLIATVDRTAVPPGTPWPGDFVVLPSGVLIHIKTPADEGLLKSQGALGPITIDWAEYERLLAK